MLMALILVVLYVGFWISLPSNSIKLFRPFIIVAYILCITIFLEGLQSELVIMDSSSTFIELFIVLIHWYNKISIHFGPNESIYLSIWVCYLPSNYIPVFFFV